MHPIVIAGLHYLDTNGFVSGVGWSFYEVKNSISAESSARKAADSKLTLDLASEIKNRESAIDAEAKARSATDQNIIATMVADSKMHTENQALIAAQIVAETKARTSAVSAESKSRKDGDAFLQAQVGGFMGRSSNYSSR